MMWISLFLFSPQFTGQNKLVDNSVKIFFRRKVDLNSSRVIFVITKSNGETK